MCPLVDPIGEAQQRYALGAGRKKALAKGQGSHRGRLPTAKQNAAPLTREGVHPSCLELSRSVGVGALELPRAVARGVDA
ncbi:hypothetical protein Sfulv_40800 [Streptomyces fulvorobeus]|uniref:Uncharacterized protein n=1 Tax=Streptomyces fulvorobeus TaxID=284028 RepID=A0A7J0C9T4_9ACTN|nr:hypothetical protein Sfulv_40800 [Streptomyces fulvorobeus]